MNATVVASSGALKLRPPDPDQLDQIQRVTSPLAWAALIVISLTISAALVWSVLYTVPVKVASKGILLSAAGVVDALAPTTGRVAELLVREGDHVVAGQLVARLSLPELDNRLDQKRRELSAAVDERAARSALLDSEDASYASLLMSQREGVRDRIAALEGRIAALREQRTGIEGLVSRGVASRDRLIAIIADVANAEKELADGENGLIQLGTTAEERRVRAARERLELDMKVAAARRDLANMEADREALTRVTAPTLGIVIEETARVGDIPPAGSPVLRLLPGSAEEARTAVTAVTFVPPEDGKKLRPGMPVNVIPTVVNVQRDGFIRGRVEQIADLPASRERMRTVLRNDRLVEQLSATGAPYMAVVTLERDANTTSGFVWSTGRGPDRVIDVGTLIQADIVVDRIRVISLVIPQIDALLALQGP